MTYELENLKVYKRVGEFYREGDLLIKYVLTMAPRRCGPREEEVTVRLLATGPTLADLISVAKEHFCVEDYEGITIASFGPVISDFAIGHL